MYVILRYRIRYPSWHFSRWLPNWVASWDAARQLLPAYASQHERMFNMPRWQYNCCQNCLLLLQQLSCMERFHAYELTAPARKDLRRSY